MKSLWAQYTYERLGIETIETARGFISFKKQGEDLFVHEFFVAPDYRKTREAWNLYQAVIAEAQALDCKRIMGCVWPGIPHAEEALIIALKCGFKLQPVKDGSVTYAKEIEDHGER